MNMMKNIYLFLMLLLAMNYQGMALTNINSGPVSGIWAASGSPYLIQGNIVVNQNQMLEIQPGVEVIFQGCYKFDVKGLIRCKGNATAPIIFKINDTTGWHVDSLPAGGWKGIDLFDYTYQGVTDTNVFEYCEIRDTKSGSLVFEQGGVLNNNRNLIVSHCKFYHNIRNTSTSSGMLCNLMLDSVKYVRMEHCEIFDNIVSNQMIAAIGYASTAAQSRFDFRNNNLHHNICGNALYCHKIKADIRLNKFEHHTRKGIHHGTLRLYEDESLVYHNQFAFNTTGVLGAITVSLGKTIIDGNLICNNQLDDGDCGVSDGGAGISLVGQFMQADPSRQYLVKNNVIANNHSVYLTGGIKVYHCNARVVNNTIVNNSSDYLGCGMTITAPFSDVMVKNNLFYGNLNNGQPANSFLSNHDIYALSFNTLYMNYNAFELPLSESIYLGSGSLSADTVQNKIGQTPYFVNPSQSVSVMDDARLRDFSLTPPSVMIDQGDTVGVFASPVDFNFNTRIINQRIDIGAIEFQNQAQGVEEPEIQSFRFFPNPVEGSFFWVSEEAIKYIRMIDLNGRVVNEVPCHGQTNGWISLEGMASGNYILMTNTGAYYQMIKR